MTQTEWLSCTEPTRMLNFLRVEGERAQVCLFAVACYRQCWDHLDDPTRRVLGVAESYAEGRITLAELRAANAGHFVGDVGEATISIKGIIIAADHAGWDVAFDKAAETYPNSENNPDAPVNAEARAAKIENYRAEQTVQCCLIRDIFGNPFHPTPVDPAWSLPRNKGLAEAIYDEENFEGLTILADALEDAGCNDAEILDHCRGHGPHVRGCWVVDLVLGKS